MALKESWASAVSSATRSLSLAMATESLPMVSSVVSSLCAT